ncbi:MAG: AMP-binding protein [Novosphingobium sp.]|jgi:long-chain acyl-CoA synthetase|uniref:class I adenylate-forming enzyme family protein n=1 Tax=Sphingobium yanoikuyae TaxID=13690 RepID=UPI0008473796|nr:AMP-binding protein [Sphingobium yanoikuyae]
MANRATHLLARAAETPEATALIFDGLPISYAQLAAQARDAMDGLAALGIGRSDRVGLWISSTPDFIVAQQALFLLGAVVTPLNILYRAQDVEHAVACCDLGRIVTTGDLAATLADAPPCPLIAIDLASDQGDIRSLPQAVNSAPPCDAAADLGEDELAMLLLTSATTGKAKGVMLSLANLAANYDRTPGWLGIDRQSVILCALPLYNTFGLNQGINAMLVTGCTMVLLPRFDAGKCIAAIAQHRCTFLPAVPTMLQKIVDHPAATAETLGSLRTIMTGGAPVPSFLLQRLLELAPDVVLLTGYGLTEASALVTLTQVCLGRNGRIERERSIGRVLDGIDLAIIDEAGREQPIGTTGEIAVRGPNVMMGYYQAPQETAAALQGQWLRTGDIGYIDSQGYAFIVDRKKDVIIRGGQNIYPADIEEVLYQFPGIAEAAVVARPDPVLGEVPVAFVALKPGSATAIEPMIDHCRAALASYKCPASIEIRDELPKGPTGKILRRALRPIPSAV